MLERMARLARSPAAREHVTAYILEEHPRFVVRQLVAVDDDSDLRWTVDTEDDLALVRALYARLPMTVIGPYRELVTAVRTRPELAIANAHVVQKPTFAEAR